MIHLNTAGMIKKKEIKKIKEILLTKNKMNDNLQILHCI